LGVEFCRILNKEHKGMKVGKLVVVFVVLIADAMVVREI
jgi:hypothetical protein